MSIRSNPMYTLTVALALATCSIVAHAQVEDSEDAGLLRGLERADRFRAPAGFSVSQVASDILTHSAIALTFDHEGRPLIGVEKRGPITLLDTNGDGRYDDSVVLHPELRSAQGLFVVQPGEYLVQADGPEGTGMYRALDTDGDLKADTVTFLLPADNGMQEHGPHAIRRGPDGALYLMYGNHVHPDAEIDPTSPSRNLQEDFFLPRYVDPRGHANSVRAPGGTLYRFDPASGRLEQIAAGFRNSYDFDFNAAGEVFTFESDMEWDIDLPWFRPVRVVHIVPGGDYGWRTGSSKKPFYYIDTLPSVDNIGRGSPVGVSFYQHTRYPARYRGALFMGDWSRGRIRVILPRQAGATYTGDTQDFIVGEPLNVTDIDVGPDGALYFTGGGRGTYGGLYRVDYAGDGDAPTTGAGVDAALQQPMPRSAWGREAIRAVQTSLGAGWESGLKRVVQNTGRTSADRVRALELLQNFGPALNTTELGALLSDSDPGVRAFSAYLLGTHPLADTLPHLEAALGDPDPVVARRACEALVRAGLNDTMVNDSLVGALLLLLNRDDRLVRHAARMALVRIESDAWADRVLSASIEKHPHVLMEGILALTLRDDFAGHEDAALHRLTEVASEPMDNDTLLEYLRVAQMALIRAADRDAAQQQLRSAITRPLLDRFPTEDTRVNRELQVVLAGMGASEAIAPMLAYLQNSADDAEQIHTVYALRNISEGWSTSQLNRLTDWFTHGWGIKGGASMRGYIDLLWDDTLALLDDDMRANAVAGKTAYDTAEREEMRKLLASLEASSITGPGDLGKLSFEELVDYLEYDPMAYSRGNAERGRRIFLRARCAECHLFGDVGTGGGPDLGTVSARFRRRDILEAIMYPSRIVSDQYAAEDIELKDGSFYTGMPISENRRKLILLNIQGRRIELRKGNIVSRAPSPISVMPEGLLESIQLGELVDLIVFLESGNNEKP